MAEQFANNAASTLNGAINDSTTTIVVATGEGSRFPSVGNFRLMIGLDPFTAEIVLATARSSDTITVVRGQEGSTAQSWGNGTSVTHIVTAGAIEQIRTQFTTVSGEIYTTNTVSVDPGGTVASDHGDGSAQLYVSGTILATKFSSGEIPATVQTFSYVSDALQSFVVPAGVTSIKVKMWGPGGGTGNYAGSGGGGPGGFSTGYLSVTPGETLYLAVGSGGKHPVSTTGNGGNGGWPGGGFGTRGDASSGGGGGFTGIFNTSMTQGNALMIAGGGGGSTGFGNFGAGGGGGLTGGSGSGSSGKGATQSAGGLDGNGVNGSTTIASGSNGVSLPTGTINVTSTTTFPTSGVLLVTTSAGNQIVGFTGKNATQFTGCTGGTGTMSTGGAVISAIAGSALTGGIAYQDQTTSQSNDCGGGGSGYFGGGAGQSDGRAGGGGSGFLHATRVTDGTTTTGSNAGSGNTTTSPPNTTDPYYSAGVGLGASATGAAGTDGGNGYIVFQWGGISSLDVDSIDFGNGSSLSTVDTNLTISPATGGTVTLSAAGTGGVTLAPGSGTITLSSSGDVIVSSGTSDMKFNVNSAQKYKIYSSGAVVIGDAVNNDTSAEAQAGLTGALINLSTGTGSFTTNTNQAIIFNQSGALNLQGNTEVRFNTGSTFRGYFDNNGILRIGSSASSGTTLQGASVPFTGNVDFLYMFNSSGSAWAEFISGTTNTRSAVQVMNVGSGGSATIGVSLFAAGASHATAEYTGNGIIEQSGTATSALMFTKKVGDGTGFASTGAIWQSGAWTIGRATTNDTSSEAQAGLTGPLLNITQTTGGSVTAGTNQALLYNVAGVATLQGTSGHNFVAGTTSIASTNTSKFITSLGRREGVTTTTANLDVLSTHHNIFVGTLSGSITVTLPSSPTTGDVYLVKDRDGSASIFNIIISGNGANIEQFTGSPAASLTLNQNYDAVELMYNGTTWSII